MLTLLGLAMAAGFFGLALPHDLLGGTGTRIMHAFTVSIPVVGPGVADFAFGGAFDGPGSLHRMWLLHVIVLPGLIGLLLAGHLALVWLQSHTQPPGGRRREDNVVGTSTIPGYAAKTAGLFLLVAAVLVALGAIVQIAPIWLYGPFEPASATVPAQPDWYLGWVEGALRIIPGVDLQVGPWEIPNPFISGVALPALVFVVLYAWPFVEERLTGDRDSHHLLDRPRDRPLRTALGVGGLTFLGVLWAAGSHDLQGLIFQVSVDRMTDFYRILLVTAPPLAGFVAWRCCHDLRRAEERALARDTTEAEPGQAP
jgi:ubiquinol-cytochrome c reductase cytochrome b subunit